MENQDKPVPISTVVLVIVALLLLAVASPLVSIWSLNTLFPVLAIPITVWTWLAMAWSQSVLLLIAARRNNY